MYIIGGTIKTMAGEDIPRGCIHIVDGKIAEIGRRDEIRIHPAASERVIEAENGLIMPGLIEAHCHMGITEEKRGWRETTAMRR